MKVELKGTDKQIAWANDIRKEVIRGWEQVKARLIEARVNKSRNEQMKEKYERTIKFVDDMLNNENAKFWIDTFSSDIKPRYIKSEDDRIDQLGFVFITVREIVKKNMKEYDLSGSLADAIQKYGVSGTTYLKEAN